MALDILALLDSFWILLGQALRLIDPVFQGLLGILLSVIGF